VNAQLADLIEVAETLPDAEIAALAAQARSRRAHLRLVPQDEAGAAFLSLLGSITDAPPDYATNVDYYIQQRLNQRYLK